MVTAWQVEPVQTSQNVRFTCLETAYDVTWQALQAGDWPDDRLAQLQREWESLDVFKSLPDTVAFIGASYVDLVQREDDPLVVEGEKALLLFYHDREVEMRRAIQSQSWAQMRQLPDMTNVFFLLPLETNLPRRVRAQLNMRRSILETTARMGDGHADISLAGQAAQAEARRRILITAIALERFRLKHGSYPKSLDALSPDWLETPPIDFMNGKPLRYSLYNNGHFLLYSVGLDEKDNGGKMAVEPDIDDDLIARLKKLQMDSDIVWPLPASTAVADANAAREGKQLQQALDAAKQRGVDAAAEAQALRLAARKELLSNPKYKKTTWANGQTQNGELMYKGQPLSALLQNSSGANRLSLDALFTLKPVLGKDPGVITFQLPIAYDRLTNIPDADLRLIMDSPPDNSGIIDSDAEYSERATNGDTLLVWDSMFEHPGLRAIQALLTLSSREVEHELMVKGPVLPFTSTNLFSFDLYAGPFNDTGANLYAELVESNATYRIEIKRDTAKPPIKTFTGSTTNGIISLDWDLSDDHGNEFTNHSFESSFTVTLTASGRTQTLTQRQNKIGTRGD